MYGSVPAALHTPGRRALMIAGQASRPVAGSIVPARAFTSGWLNMSYVICPVASPVPPASSNSVMLKPPRPGSFCDSTSSPPPPSCSPFSGKSSSNMNTESFEGGNGSGCVSTVSGAATPGTTVPAGTPLVAGGGAVQVGAVVPAYRTAVQVVTPAVVVQLTAAGTGTPPMPWPQAPGLEALAVPFMQSADRFALANGLPASPGKTVR